MHRSPWNRLGSAWDCYPCKPHSGYLMPGTWDSGRFCFSQLASWQSTTDLTQECAPRHEHDRFCHQMGPHQRLRAHTLCTQLLVRLHIFFNFRQINRFQVFTETQNYRNMFLMKQKPPVGQNCHNETLANLICFKQIQTHETTKIPNPPILQQFYL